MKKYCIWNNKGGVGKTFLTYLLATEYAKNNPSKQVIVIDMCPQANVSEILLGGNGKGQDNLEALFKKDLTVASYIKKRFSEGSSFLSQNINDYFVKIRTYNDNLPDNLYLLTGDNELDICSSIINYISTSPAKNSWRTSRSLLLDLIEAYSKNQMGKDQVYFIDCNPSFSPYTELAIVASDRLIVPCTADNASMRGLRNVFKLLYGSNQDDNQFTQFSEKVVENKINLPKIYRIAQNKSRSHQQNASQAFKANLEQIQAVIHSLSNEYNDKFFDANREIYNIKDGNTLATVINHTGQMLGDVVTSKKTPVYEHEVQVNESQKKALIEDVRLLADQL